MGWPEQKVEYYLEMDTTLAACEEMREYLTRHRQQLDFADEAVENLSRLIESVGKEESEAGSALAEYTKISGRRKWVMEHAIDVIHDLRPLVRRDLGMAHPDYVAIKWPAMVSPDPM
jgi:hypothetical protein